MFMQTSRVSYLNPNFFLLINDAFSIDNLQAQQQELQAQNEGIVAQSDSESRAPNDEELALIEENENKIENLARQIEARQKVEARRQGAGPRTQNPNVSGNNAPNSNSVSARTVAVGSRPTVPASARPQNEAATFGFRNFGEYAITVRAAGGPSPDHQSATRLHNALTTFGSESTGADGGFAVPPDFRREIAEKVLGENSLAERTDQQTTSSNSIVFPMDETTPWQTSGGIQAYWEVEAGQKTQSKPALGQSTVRLHKLIALVPMTDELLEDAPALDGYLRRKVPDKFTAKLNTAIISGTGVGMPKGILTSGSLITVPKETSQDPDTIYFENIVKMVTRLYAPSMANAVWLINQNILPQLMTMQFVRTATSPVPVWMPATGVSGSPYSTLMGRPVIPVQAMPTLGDKGDIVLADMRQYLMVTKGQQIRTDVSIHLFFDYDVTAFRFVMRVAGQPWWDAPIVQQNASEDLGFFVALAERA